MNTLTRLLAMTLLCLPLGTHATEIGPVEKEIAGLEQTFNQVYAANDLAKYFAYYADDLVAMFPEGRTDLKAYRKEWNEFIGSGNRLTANTISDLLVRVSPLGDEATASYLVEVRTKLKTGKVTVEHFQETDLWLKREGTWKVAYVHYSVATTPKKP